jgi:hypothetical protein
MTGPLSSSDHGKIQSVDHELDQLIKQARSGPVDTQTVSALQQQLLALAKNPKIPTQVRQSLENALNELKQMQSGELNVDNLYTAKIQIDNFLSSSEPSGGESSGEKKSGGSELGGGSGEGG